MSKLINKLTAMLLSGILVMGSVSGSVFASEMDVDPEQTSEVAVEEAAAEESAMEQEDAEETSADEAGEEKAAEEEETVVPSGERYV